MDRDSTVDRISRRFEGDEADETTPEDEGSEQAGRERRERRSESDGERKGRQDRTRAQQAQEYPYVLRRQRVKDERPEIHQLHIQAETDERAVRAETELEERFGKDLPRLDVREAIYLAGLENLDDAEAVLDDWGHGV